MSPLFKRIYTLLRQGQNDIHEDYLTEIISEIFKDKGMLIKFFHEFTDIALEDPSHIQVTTQRTFLKLPEHEIDSRLDLVVQFHDNGKPFIAFFVPQIVTGPKIFHPTINNLTLLEIPKSIPENRSIE
ncbi:MAG: hypothetical protein MIO93_16320 [ANME-2 cluster archaeon]|nr:hypothetical protein [ANME-2 cluster archaeon]